MITSNESNHNGKHLPKAGEEEASNQTNPNSPEFFVVWRNATGSLERGPLQVLWDLIESYQIDILDVSLERLTVDFLEFLRQCKELTLEVAASFMHTAARLLYYKSKSLLPDQDFEKEEQDQGRLPPELVKQLLEYRKYQMAALQLQEYAETSMSMFSKSNVTSIIEENPKIPTEEELNPSYLDLHLNDIIIIYSKLLQRIAKEQKKIDEKLAYQTEEYSVQDKCIYLEELLENAESFSFNELFEDPNQIKLSELVATFLALLELTRRHKIIIRQKGIFGEIRIFKKESLTKITSF